MKSLTGRNMGLAPHDGSRNLVPWRCDICHTTGRTKPVRSNRTYMEDNTVTTVNEELENLEESTEDSSQESTVTQDTQVNPDTAVDENLQEVTGIHEPDSLSSGKASETNPSAGDLIEE